ncbi:MAG: DUF2065 domain-containing protein [Defluviicoccus sp.]|nr:DUF2065 domain-containing protein [Defluviicoccus sp.]MDE0384359.1 DUF2065 domain-containing protein [Defluviicoccus sp.]
MLGTDLLAAIALALAIEGALYALFPDAMKRFIQRVSEQPANALRTAGLIATALGVGLAWLVRG